MTVTPEELRKAFESQYGEKVECRIILWPHAKEKEALDQYSKLRDNETAFAAVKELYQKEKLLVSPSSATVYAAMKKYPIQEGIVVGIFADDGRKFKSVYSKQNIMSEKEFDDALKNAKYLSNIAYL